MNDYAVRRRVTRFGTSLLLQIAVAPAAQTFQGKPDTAPQFEVATIKPSNPAFRPGRLAIFGDSGEAERLSEWKPSGIPG